MNALIALVMLLMAVIIWMAVDGVFKNNPRD